MNNYIPLKLILHFGPSQPLHYTLDIKNSSTFYTTVLSNMQVFTSIVFCPLAWHRRLVCSLIFSVFQLVTHFVPYCWYLIKQTACK